MQIVIDIPEAYYEALRKTDAMISGQRSGKTLMSVIYNAIANGIPLPKGHGDLIDRTELYNQTAEWEAQALEQVNKFNPAYSRDEWRWWSAVLKERGAFKHDVADTPTIIEADKAEQEAATH